MTLQSSNWPRSVKLSFENNYLSNLMQAVVHNRPCCNRQRPHQDDIIMHFSSEASPMGIFSHLPKEIRIMIWNELFPGSRSSNPCRLRQRCLAILATSHQLLHEIRTELYHNRIITFHISASPVAKLGELYPVEPSCIKISDKLGCTWVLYRQGNKKEQAGDMCLWQNLPYQKLKGVRFELTAPDPSNPGELVQMWNKLCFLMDVLQRAKKFSRVEIDVKETSREPWFADGQPNHSLSTAPFGITRHFSDLDILLSVFRRLRRAKHVEVNLPFAHIPNSISNVATEISQTIIQRIPFGLTTYIEEEDDDEDEDEEEDAEEEQEEEDNDELIAAEESTWTLWLDWILDDLPGPAAAFARLERFAHWPLHYSEKLWDLLHIPVDPASHQRRALLLTPEAQHGAQDAFERRLVARHNFQPMGFQRDGPAGFDVVLGHHASSADVCSAVEKLQWGPADWSKSYPSGIPRVSSIDFAVQMAKQGGGVGLVAQGAERSFPWSFGRRIGPVFC